MPQHRVRPSFPLLSVSPPARCSWPPKGLTLYIIFPPPSFSKPFPFRMLLNRPADPGQAQTHTWQYLGANRLFSPPLQLFFRGAWDPPLSPLSLLLRPCPVPLPREAGSGLLQLEVGVCGDVRGITPPEQGQRVRLGRGEAPSPGVHLCPHRCPPSPCWAEVGPRLSSGWAGFLSGQKPPDLRGKKGPHRKKEFK